MAGIAEITDYVAQQTNQTKVQARASVYAVIDAISVSLANKEAVTFRGFGSFKVKTLKARTGRNPQTGAAIEIASRDKVVFKESK